MMAFLDVGPWVTEHWWLAFWLVFWAMCFGFGLANGGIRIVSRAIRMILVLLRGWPPAHLDADGDWKPAEDRPPLDREEIVSIGDRVHTTRHYREVKS